MQIFESLSLYLTSAQETLENWGHWLKQHELLIMAGDVEALQAHLPQAARLEQCLAQLRQNRTALLEQARSAGLACESLYQLAQALPQWQSDAALRWQVQLVQRQMTNLQRLNLAAWMLVSQCSRTIDETILLMTSGNATQGAYIHVPHADTSGGQILDTEI